MVLISIQPFAFKRICLLVAVLLCLSSAICFADSLFVSLHSSRNRRQLNRNQPVALSIPDRTVQPRSLLPGKHWMENLRRRPDGYYQEPLLLIQRAIGW